MAQKLQKVFCIHEIEDKSTSKNPKNCISVSMSTDFTPKSTELIFLIGTSCVLCRF